MKRPINKRFRQAVLDGVKTTTIRKTPWPVGVPITLYSWAGKPYRSKHEDICQIVVKDVFEIRIRHDRVEIQYEFKEYRGPHSPLWKTEGFANALEMHEWFAGVIRQGETQDFWLMEFEVLK